MKGKLHQEWLSWVLVIICAVLVVLQFYEHIVLQVILGIASWCLFIAAMQQVKSLSRWICGVLTASGFALFLTSGNRVQDMFAAISTNAGILGIFLTVPIIGIAIRTGGYLRAIQQKTLLERKKGKSRPYFIANVLSLFLAPFLNVGVISILYEMAHKALDGFYSKRMGVSLYRAFGTMFYWSPFSISTVLIIHLFHVQWSILVLYLLAGLFFHLLLMVILFKRAPLTDDVWIQQQDRDNTVNVKSVHKKLGFLLMIMGGLIGLAVLLEVSTTISMSVIIILLSIFYSFIWMVSLRKTKRFAVQMKGYVQNSFQMIKNEAILLLSAGFFATAVGQSQFNVYVMDFFTVIAGWPTIYFILALFSIFIVTGFIGIHNVVLITLFGTVASLSENFGNIYFFPAAIMLAVVLQNQTSPLSILAVTVSNRFKINMSALIKENLLFVAILFVVFTGVLLVTKQLI